MPLSDNAFGTTGERFIVRVKDIKADKVTNNNPALREETPFVDGYIFIAEQLWPLSSLSRDVPFPVSTNPRSKWGMWKKWWKDAGIPLSNDTISKIYLFEIRDMSWGTTISVSLPYPVMELTAEQVKVLKSGRIDLMELDLEQVPNFQGMLESASVDNKPNDVVNELIAILQAAGGGLNYDKLAVKVLTDSKYSANDALKTVIMNKDELKAQGFKIDEESLVTFNPF